MRVTEMAAALHANSTAFSSAKPSEIATAIAPLKISPAAVVSIASTFGDGISIASSPVKAMHLYSLK